jgi:hypothetical protein
MHVALVDFIVLAAERAEILTARGATLRVSRFTLGILTANDKKHRVLLAYWGISGG